MSFLEKLFDVKDKVIVITGGSGVLGSKIAGGFLQAGSKVILLGTNPDKLDYKVRTLRKENHNVSRFVCNVLDEDNVIKTNENIINQFKRIDVLINAAGGQIQGTTMNMNQNIFDLKINDFNKVTELNLVGTVLPTLIFGKTIAKQKRGSIINISSMASLRAITRVAGYSAAKAAVDNFTKWLAVEIALKFGDEIRVNSIAPGFFISNQNRNVLVNKNGNLTQRGKSILKLTPFKRFGKPEELIGISIFLASDASKFITGTVIPVDGGFSVFSGV
jgi:NAD(P)-dependent dehydrogenase (short-subunit alcohol dehydrogenase family)